MVGIRSYFNGDARRGGIVYILISSRGTVKSIFILL